MPPITLHFLQASRSIRTAWLLEELHQPYSIRFSPRENKIAPQSFKDSCGNPLGKAPTIQDGGLTVYESGAITEYLCEVYDEEGRMMPRELEKRVRVLMWVHAAEGTFMLHALAIVYARWNAPARVVESGDLKGMEEGMAGNVRRDLDWLEEELGRCEGGFLVGESVTAADVMMQFSIDFILARGLGTQGRRWQRVEAWLERCKDSEGFRRAVEKTGYDLSQSG